MRGTIVTAVLLSATLGGCYTTGQVGYRATYSSGYSGDAYVSSPDLVTVSPGVQVVADYDEPVFYTDGFYWRFDNGGWYRSNNYATGWFYVDRPPVAVLRIDRPHAYVHYRPTGYAVRSRGRYRPPERIVRDQRRQVYRPEPVVRERREVRPDPNVRDHRDPNRTAPVVREAPRSGPAPRPAPATRDHRRDRDDDNTRDHRH